MDGYPNRRLRIEASAALAAAGGVALLVSLFLTWYDPDLTAWTAFEVLDLVLAAIAIASLVAAASEVGFGAAIPARWLPALGGVALVVVVAALINHPPLALGHPPRAGIWLAFGASLLILTGGLLRVARISLAVTFDGGDAQPPVRPRPPSEAHTEPLPPE
jgi:hypothetical protein